MKNGATDSDDIPAAPTLGGRDVDQELARLYDASEEFNASLDETATFTNDSDTGIEIQVGGSSFPPSRVLALLDPEGYLVALEEWEERQAEQRAEEELYERLEHAREVLRHRDNRDRFERIVEKVRSHSVVPFIGAGMSKPCGNELWGEFLLRLAESAGQDPDLVRKRLEDGDFEGVANDLLHEWRNPPWFAERLRDAYELNVELRGGVLVVTELFQHGAITTNFDLVLETAYQQADAPFQSVERGPSPEPFTQVIAGGQHHLLKVHGDVRFTTDRILDKAEYDGAYGSPDLNTGLPLPKALARAFTSRTLLFLGCSLMTDRTMAVWRALVDEHGDELPSHYAAIEEPTDAEDWNARENELTELHIFPIWYPPGDHGAVEDLLVLLREILEGRETVPQPE